MGRFESVNLVGNLVVELCGQAAHELRAEGILRSPVAFAGRSSGSREWELVEPKETVEPEELVEPEEPVGPKELH